VTVRRPAGAALIATGLLEAGERRIPRSLKKINGLP